MVINMLGFPIKKINIKSNGIKQKNIKKANLGMLLEDMINESNLYYLDKNIAIIHKKPIPVQIVKVDYPNREHAVIREAYYKVPSTTDYNGIYKGKYIDFEAKESNSLTSFPLANVHPHQVTHLKGIIEHGGIGFIIVYFKKHGEAFLMPFDIFYPYWENQKSGRKSIPYEIFEEKCHKIAFNYLPKLDYLRVVDEIYF